MRRRGCAQGFRHEALFYRGGLRGFVHELAPMVSETLSSGGGVAIAAPAERVARMHGLFGDHPRLTLVDMTGLGANPARIIPALRDFVDAQLRRGASFLAIGEPIWAGRTADEIIECHRHEALIDVAFADDPHWRLVCPYDVDGLSAEVIAHARATHPVSFDRLLGRSEAPVNPSAVLGRLAPPLLPVPGDARTLHFGPGDLPAARDLARQEAARAGLGPVRAADLLLAIGEMAANSIRHGGGSGRLDLWTQDERVVGQTTDAGHVADPLVGRRRPDLMQDSGRGMWIVQQVCDLVQLRTSPAGTTLRVTVA